MDPQQRTHKPLPSLRVWLLSIALVAILAVITALGVINRGPSTPEQQAVALCRHNIRPTECAQRRLDARAKDERR